VRDVGRCSWERPQCLRKLVKPSDLVFPATFADLTSNEKKQAMDQGDRIGQFRTNWAIVFFRQFFRRLQVAQNFLGCLGISIETQLIIIFYKIWVGLDFGRLFCKLTWPPWRWPSVGLKMLF
jgi:hypothetical protein